MVAVTTLQLLPGVQPKRQLTTNRPRLPAQVAEVSGKKRVFKAPNPDAGNVPRILAIDCGMKYNITRLLVSHNVHLTVVP